MKNRSFLLVLLFSLSFWGRALAISAPSYGSIPSRVDAPTYTIHFSVEPGSKVTIVGGPADIAPVKDGLGNPVDGKVDITVGLAQNQTNVFSVTASKDGNVSAAITIKIKEGPEPGTEAPRGDTTPPLAPLLETIPEELSADEYTFSGSSEADANISARWSEGNLAGSTRANSQGLFQLTLRLKRGKTNRINFSAEDGAGNEGPATQAVIRVQAMPRGSFPEDKNQESASMTEEAAAPFIDIRGHWAESFVKELYKKGVVGGKTQERFDPNGEITRAELTKIAVNAFGYDLPMKVEAKPFRDVPADAWFAPYIAVAKSEGIAQGFSDGFHPNDPITRAAALKILFEASGLPKLERTDTVFKDVPGGAWFYSYVMSAAGNDIVAGFADKTFRPEKPITRAEVSKIVVKIKKLLE